MYQVFCPYLKNCYTSSTIGIAPCACDDTMPIKRQFKWLRDRIS
jgi:hypothetical protein